MLLTQWIIRNFSTSAITLKKIPHSLKGKSKSSQSWLIRQLKDPYVKLAKYSNYRARSAFKLIEIDDKVKLLKPGQVVLECGASPGAWTQVIVPKINSLPNDIEKPQGMVISFDVSVFAPVNGAIILNKCSVTDEDIHLKIEEHLQGKKVDVVLSDMAPNATGVKDMDHEIIYELGKNAFDLALAYSKKGGAFLCKLWDGSNTKSFEKDLANYYRFVKIIKPSASRSNSAELFILGRDFMAR